MTEVLREPFNNFSGWNNSGAILAPGRFSPWAAQVTGVSNNATFIIPSAYESDTIIVGFAVKIPSLTNDQNLVQFRGDGGTVTHTLLSVTSAGTLRASNAALSTVVSTASGAIVADTWYYVEARYVLHDSTGSVELRLNGAVVGTATNIDTKSSSTKVVYDSIRLAPPNATSGGTVTYDDLYIRTGSAETFAGDRGSIASTLLLLDGCEDYSSWVHTGGSQTIVTGRNGNGFRMNGLSTTDWTTFSIPAIDQTDTLTVGFAVRTSILSALPSFRLCSDNGVTEHNRIQFSSTTLEVTRATTAVFTASYSWAVNTWYYVEVTVKLSDTIGQVTARVNGVTIGTSVATLDTKNVGTKTIYDAVRLMSGMASSATVDDIYITNDGSLLGDVVIETLYPDGNGFASAWTGSDGNSTDNYQLVDEAGTADTADYVQSSTTGQQDLYTMGALAAGTGTVRGVCHAAHAIKTDSGSRSLRLLQRGAATNTSNAQALATAWANSHWAATINPETGIAYTRAEVNALQSGVECA